jgi:hypothetical protein
VNHLFWNCPFAQECWALVNIETIQEGTIFQNITTAKDQLHNQFFMVLIILMSWTIWKVRNELIFNNRQMSVQETKNMLSVELNLVYHRVNERLKPSFSQWIQSLF